MTIQNPIHIHCLVPDSTDKENVSRHLQCIEKKLEVDFFENMRHWKESIDKDSYPDILFIEYNPDIEESRNNLEEVLILSQEIHIILFIDREFVSQAIQTLQLGVEDYITKNVISKIIPSMDKIIRNIEADRNLNDQRMILRRIEKKNTALLDAQPDFMLQVSRDGLILDYKPSKESRALQEILAGHELQGQELRQFFSEEITSEMLHRIQKVMDTHEPQDFLFRLMSMGVQHKMEARFVRLTHIECLLIIREFQADNEREEEYYRAISRISRYRHKENLVKELLNHMVDSDKNLLSEEKKKADLLLSNILPGYMIEDLKKFGKVQPVQYDNASVMFTDFVGFSKISKYMSPTQLLKELTIYFDEFERICETYGIEKVKTIGDSFLCVSGLGKNQRTATIDNILAGIEMARFTYERKKELELRGEDAWGIRIAIHSGALIAGVVGHKKIAFDIWGHTVNTASRIESIAEGGKITVSRSVYDAARDYFEFDFEGERELKGVGSLDVYTLKSIRKGLFHPDSEGMIPNQNFYRLYEALRDGKHILFHDGKYRISSPRKEVA